MNDVTKLVRTQHDIPISAESQIIADSISNTKNAISLAAAMVIKNEHMQSTIVGLVLEIEKIKNQAKQLAKYMEEYVPEDRAAIEMANKLGRGSEAPNGEYLAQAMRKAVSATKKASIEAVKSCSSDTMRELSESISLLDRAFTSSGIG
jgi:plasmid replication initiation protein